MSINSFGPKLLSIINVIILLFCPYTIIQAWASNDIPWRTIKTKNSIICYLSQEDLKTFNKKVDYLSDISGLKRIFSRSNPDNFTDQIIKKVDALFERVQEVLGMYKKMKKVFIYIYPNKRQLHDAYFKIFNRESNLRAWYLFENNTIYLNVKDLHEGILVHEIAHSIIDNYLTVRPPTATAEILARYVDKHLCHWGIGTS